MKTRIVSLSVFSIIVLSFFFTLNAQDGSDKKPKIWQQEYSAIINGQTVGDAYSGGKSNSAPAFADIDNDGDFDLFIGENEGNINFYRNDGTPNNASWTFISKDYNFIDVGSDSKPTFTDIDNDGDMDLFIGESDGNINFYCNNGTPEVPSWTLVNENYGSIDIGDYCVPAFADIDNDGYIELFIGEKDGNINFYQNDGTAENAKWTLVTENYESIDVGTYSAPAFADIDNDGDMDLFVGEQYGNINFYRNDDTAENAQWTLVTDNYRSINVGGMSCPAFADIDNDGDMDFFIGEEDGNINFHRNDGTALAVQWTLITENYESIDVGFYSTPVFADIDNDGDMDLFIGKYSGNINFYRNDGTAENAQWTLVTENYESIDVGTYSAPAFADIDNDNDMDLFIGEEYGNINFYRNDGTDENAQLTLVTENFESIDIGVKSCPAFADIDNDGDMDLFIGENGGNINFYRNNGTPENAQFTHITYNYESIDIGSYSAPNFADMDNDGDIDLCIGEEYGNIYFYKNDGTPENALFTYIINDNGSINSVKYSTPAFADIDNDGDTDLFFGESPGNIYFYLNEGTLLTAQYSFITDTFNSYIDVGKYSTPTFADIDDDGDLDLFIGELDGNISFYRNDGTPGNASWTFISKDYNFIDVGSASKPTFTDIDNDGTMDLFIGESYGNIYHYRNDGTSEVPSWTLVSSKYESIDVGYYSTPVFADIDNDGDIDLFIGENDGNIYFYRNDGTVENAQWTLVTENYESIDVGTYSVPAFTDIDNDGDIDLFIGEEYGNINYYRNDGTPEVPSWTLITENYESIDVGSHSSPVFADIYIYYDAEPDLFVGNESGGIYFWRKFVYELDLLLDYIEAPSIWTIGDSLKILNVIRNESLDTAWNFTVNFYISADTIINNNDLLLGSRTITELNPYSNSEDSAFFKIPADFSRGYYYIGAIVDINNIVPEINENNNTSYNSNIIYVSNTGEYNVKPSLYGGKVIPDTGHSETDYTFLVNFIDPDNEPPSFISIKIDDDIIQSMTLKEEDGDYSNGELYEYKTNLSQGEHTFSFSAGDGLADATGDIYLHTGPVVGMANTPPILANGKVYPETGTPSTEFCFSVIYSDSDNDTCSEILITIDDNPPIPMSPAIREDYDCTDGMIYQYKTKLDTSEHTYSLSASDWSDEASGDISIHSGPDVSLSGLVPMLSNGIVTPQSGIQDTVFTYSVVYTNHDGFPPTIINIKIDDNTFGMDPVGEDINDDINGVTYEYKTTMDTSDHTYSFIAECNGILAGGDTSLHYGPLVSDSSSASFIPSDGKWIGETNQGNPVLFYVSENGSKVVDFQSSIFVEAMFICENDTNYWHWTLSAEIEEMNISDNNFSGSGDDGTHNKFTGSFTSQASCTGTMDGLDVTLYNCHGWLSIFLSGEGTWNASLQSIIKIDEPQNKALVNTPLVEVSGTVSGALVKTAKINDVAVEINKGSFSTNVTLNEGDNNIVLSAYDDNNHLVGTHSIVVYLDNTAPVVTITEPVDNIETKSQEIIVTGTINDPSVSYIDINNKKVCVVDGQFESLIPLSIGENSITAVCFDEAGNIGSDTITTTLLCMNEYTYITETICEGDSFQFGDYVYTEPGVYFNYLESQYGCDSIVTLDLIVNPIDETYLNKTICQGDSMVIGGSVFKTAGYYSVTLANQYGCDSIVTLDLFVNPVDETDLYETICKGDSVVIGGIVFKTAGNYSVPLSNQYACDSIVTLHLIVNPVDETYLYESICQGDSIIFAGSVFKTTGNYSVPLSNQYGCDSTTTLYLTVHPLPHVTIGNDTVITEDEMILLYPNSSFNNYLWSTGETAQSIEIIGEELGTGEFEYWLTVTDDNNCSNSDTILITVNESTGIRNLLNNGYVKFYPNPANDFLNLEINGIKEKIRIDIISANGRTLITKNYKDGLNITDNLDLKGFISGWYIIKVQTDRDIKTNKFLLIK